MIKSQLCKIIYPIIHHSMIPYLKLLLGPDVFQNSAGFRFWKDNIMLFNTEVLGATHHNQTLFQL